LDANLFILLFFKYQLFSFKIFLTFVAELSLFLSSHLEIPEIISKNDLEGQRKAWLEKLIHL